MDETGSVFSGEFEDGQLHGEVLVAPFGLPAYRAEFSEGSEISGTQIEESGAALDLNLHLTQSKRLSDARVGLALDPSPPPGWHGGFSPSYLSSSDGATMRVHLANPEIRSLWLSDRQLPVLQGDDSILGEHFDPVFSLSFENTGSHPLQCPSSEFLEPRAA